MTWFLIALRNILRDRVRVVSTMLIMVVGLAALLIGGGFMLATYDALQEIAIRSEGHVIVINADAISRTGGANQQLTLANWQDISTQLLADERVIRVLPRARFEGLIINETNASAFFGTGVDPTEEFRVHGPFLRISQGDTLDPWLTADDTPEIMLGWQLAQTLNAQVDTVLTVKTLRADGKENHIVARVVGLYRTGSPEIDDHTVYTSLTTVATLLGSESISQLSIYLHDREDVAAIKQMLEGKLGGSTIQTWNERAELYHKVKALYDRIFSVMGLILLIVVFLAISNTVSLAIYQRRKEIATLAALGTLPGRIYSSFVIEACLIGIVATSLGMLVAAVGAFTINAADMMMPAPPGKSEGYPLYIYISLVFYAATSLVLIIVTVVAALIAAHKAVKVNISEALS